MKKPIIIIIFTILIAMFIPKSLDAVATTLGDLYDELDDLKRQKQEKVEEKKLSEAEYNQISSEIRKKEKEIEDLSNQIIEASNKIESLTKQIEEKKKETENILVFLEISSGEKSYLEYIFKATSFTDLIHRISVVEQISNYNDELINEMNEMIEENKKLKEKLADDTKKASQKRDELVKEQAKVRSKINTIYEHTTTIDEDIETQKAVIEVYEKAGCKLRTDILKDCMDIPTATGFLRPFANGKVTSWYGSRIDPITKAYEQFHNGVDIASKSGEGTPIYPVAAGKVAVKTKWGCGGNVLFIYHNIKGVQYTSVYLHMIRYADNIKVGDIVTANDVIGYMGGYTTSKNLFPKTGWDTCSTGAHLHLAIAMGNHGSSTYLSYKIDPTSVIYLPSGWYTSRSW